MAWNKDSPAAGIVARQLDNDIRANNAALETQLGHGHNFPTDGGHKKGSAICYYQAAAPTTKQDGATVLDANDDGSLWIDSDASPKVIYYYVHGTGWVALGTIISLLDEDDMVSDDATKAATQQSIKAYVDSGVSGIDLTPYFEKDGSVAFSGTGVGFRDEDNMASDDATAAASQQSIKKYVDDQIAANQDPSYSGGESHTFNGGLIIKAGYKARSGSTTTVTFGSAFPNDIIAVVPGNKRSDGTSEAASILNESASGFQFRSESSISGIYWIAIGY